MAYYVEDEKETEQKWCNDCYIVVNQNNKILFLLLRSELFFTFLRILGIFLLVTKISCLRVLCRRSVRSVKKIYKNFLTSKLF